jgi:hypothetical protein
MPWRRLALLTLAVLGVHALLLQAAPGALSLEEARHPRSFQTRTIPFTPPSPQPPPASPAASRAMSPTTPAAAAAAAAPPPRSIPSPATALAPTFPTGVTAPMPAASSPVPSPVTPSTPESSNATAASAAPAPVASAPAGPVPSAPAVPVASAPAVPETPRPVGPATATLTAVPGSLRLSYSVSGLQGQQPLSGVTAELLWQHDGQQYEAQLSYRLLFGTLRSQRSQGRITPQGLAPDRFSDKRRSEVAAHFDRSRARITFSANTPDVPLLVGAQDRLSVFLQLAALLAGQPGGYPPGTSIPLQTVGPRDADVWTFTVGALENLNLPAGAMGAVHLVREPRRPFDQRVEVWLAPELAYLPVRIRVTESNGDSADQQLRSSSAP